MSSYVREDGSPAVEPVNKNPMLGTFTDAEGVQVFEKAAAPSGGGDNSAVLSAIGGLGLKVSAQQAAIKDISDRLKAAGI